MTDERVRLPGQAYAAAEVKDLAARVACFSADSVFVDRSVAVTHRGALGHL